MNVEWTKTGLTDLDNVHHQIGLSSPHYAKATVEKIIKRCSQLEAFPMSGSVVPEYGRDDIREIFVYSYRIIHYVPDSNVFVLSVLHGSNPIPPTPPIAR